MKAKRIIAMLLCAMMLVSLLPAMAFADEDEEIIEVAFGGEEVLPGEPAQEETVPEITEDEEVPAEPEASEEDAEPEESEDDGVIPEEPETEGEDENFDLRIVADGTCGKNIEWRLLSTGELLIAGTGNMPDYSNGTAPWYSYKDSIKKILIGDGIESIGACAFYECGNVTSVEIPDSVYRIAHHAFTYCASITGITLPELIYDIGAGAFFGCSKLESITLPKGISTIGEYAFKQCSALTEITVPSSVTSIGSGAFSFCKNLKTAVINAIIAELPDSIFQEDTALESVTLPRGLKKINAHAFMKCNALSTVAFSGSKMEWDTINIVTTNNEPLLAAHITYAIPDNACGPKLIWEFNSANGKLEIAGTGPMFDFKRLGSEDYAPWYSHRNEIKQVVIHEGATSIGSYAFEDCIYLADISIPDSVIKIGSSAFYRNMALRYIELPSGLSEISPGMFAYSALKSITLPSSVKIIGEAAFLNCGNLNEVTLNVGLETIGPSAFSGCAVLEGNEVHGIQIPSTVKRIVSRAFAGCTKLKVVEFAGNAPKMDENIFFDTVLTARYPADNETWTSDVMKQYGGTVTWERYGGKAIPVFTTVANHADYMIVCWTKVEGAVSYRLAYREGAQVWTFQDVPLTSVDSKGNPRVNIKYLKEGANYTFMVYAVFADGSMTKSESASQTRLLSPTVTAKAGNGYVNLTWNEVQGGSQYKIYYREKGGSWQLYAWVKKDVHSVNVKESIINANGLPPLIKGHTYEFAVILGTSVPGITSGFPTTPVSVKY